MKEEKPSKLKISNQGETVMQKLIDKFKSLSSPRAGFKFGGYFTLTCIGPDGKIKWTELAKNLVVNEGLDHILDVVLHGTTPVSPWYVGLKNTGAMAAGDTQASHGNWTENANYTGNRQEYVEAAASSQSTTNSASKASFSIDTDSQSIYGAFLVAAATGDGVLLCGADFASAKSADDGDTLEVTYTVSAADDGA
jgi:hypothetical protein